MKVYTMQYIETLHECMKVGLRKLYEEKYYKREIDENSMVDMMFYTEFVSLMYITSIQEFFRVLHGYLQDDHPFIKKYGYNISVISSKCSELLKDLNSYQRKMMDDLNYDGVEERFKLIFDMHDYGATILDMVEDLGFNNRFPEANYCLQCYLEYLKCMERMNIINETEVK